MMDTLLCLIYFHANTFTPIYTCLKIQFLKISSGYPEFPSIQAGTRLCPIADFLPMLSIVPQSAPIVSAADVSVKL